jgi:hypothetical protein
VAEGMKKILIWPARFPYSEYDCALSLFGSLMKLICRNVGMSICEVGSFVDLCRMIEKYILNVSTGADSEHKKNAVGGEITTSAAAYLSSR